MAKLRKQISERLIHEQSEPALPIFLAAKGEEILRAMEQYKKQLL
jgi:hypothetical protein